MSRVLRLEPRVPQLSDTGTRAYKFRFIGSVAAVVVAIGIAVGLSSEPRSTPLMLGLLVVMVLAALAWSVRRIPWAIADQVADEGSYLQVRRRSAQARVAFEDIADIQRDATGYARYVRLALVRAIPPFGTEVVFRPRDYAWMTTEDLNRLIEELRARAPKAASTQNATERRNLPATDLDSLSRTLTRKRVILACVVALVALAAGNYLLGSGMFAPFDKRILVGCALVLAIAVHLFSPTIDEMDGDVDARIARKKRKREFR